MAKLICGRGEIILPAVLKTEFIKLFRRKEFNIVLTLEIVLICTLFDLRALTYYKAPTSELPSAYQMWIGYINSNVSFIDFSYIGDIYYLFFLTLPASIVFADTYLEDKKGNVLNFIITRCDKSLYVLSKGIVVFFSGFIIIFLPLLLDQLLYMIAFPLYAISEVNAGNPVYDKYYLTQNYFKNLHTLNPYLHNLLYIFLDGFFGGTIAVLSYAVSFFKKVNRYIVVVLPTILFLTQNFIFALLGKTNYCLSYYLNVSPSIGGLDYKVFGYSILGVLIASLFMIVLNARGEEI
ncbi:hypothetical protein [Thermoanaerobacter mathranii]|uniref:hypothetical protein n=1 Tax=Thermoanaerobacter mathranii TaxID=583357 RepID=UPI003D6A8CB6